jgi:signal transduction histidine kinase
VDDLFSPDAALYLYRIVQESLNNILKHARASRVSVVVERDLREVHLRVEDNGVGFALGNAGGLKGLGLKNIAERTRMLGGQLQINSAPDQGTRIEVTIPTPERPG